MSIQFRLGNNDHKPVEDFLSRQHAGTGAIILDSKAARHQVGAAEAARRAGIGVYWEPATERLASAGYGVEKYPMWAGQPYDLDALATSSKERGALVELLLSTQPSLVTHVTAPHFYVTDQRSAHLNIALAEMTRLSTIQPVRAVLTIANKFGLASAADLAKEYAAAGIQAIEIRLSPLGGDDESLRKIRDAYAIVRLFKDAGLHVTLGSSGNIGQVAVAMGYADSFSVGVGMLERVNHSSVINRQKQPPKERTEDESGGGPIAGIYLPGVAATVTRRAGNKLLENTDIRVSLGCRIDSCSGSVRGPAEDPRRHYLHARAHEMATMLERPAAWRPTLEVDRLRQANNLRRRVNKYYLDDEIKELKTRTLMSLINGIEEQRQAS